MRILAKEELSINSNLITSQGETVSVSNVIERWRYGSVGDFAHSDVSDVLNQLRFHHYRHCSSTSEP